VKALRLVMKARQTKADLTRALNRCILATIVAASPVLAQQPAHPPTAAKPARGSVRATL